MTRAALIKKESWGLAYSFRSLVHYRYDREHGTAQVGMVGTAQVGMVLDKQLRATSWSTSPQKAGVERGPLGLA